MGQCGRAIVLAHLSTFVCVRNEYATHNSIGRIKKPGGTGKVEGAKDITWRIRLVTQLECPAPQQINASLESWISPVHDEVVKQE